MATTMLPRTDDGSADEVVPAGVREARLAELVRALSGCPLHRAFEAVRAADASDPLDAVAASLCDVLPPRVAGRRRRLHAAR
jgi:hypothetical protein